MRPASTRLHSAVVSAALLSAACSSPLGVPTWGPPTLPLGYSGSAVLYVANRWGDSIFVYEMGSSRPSREIRHGVASPIALARDRAGDLFVGNAGDGRNAKGWVSIYPSGAERPAREITSGIRELQSIALDHAGDLFAANRGGQAIYEYARGTTSIQRTITQGVFEPVAIAVDASGFLYVSNCQSCAYPSLNDTITIYAPKNEKLFRTIVTSYRGPSLIAFDHSGNAYVDVAGSINIYAKHSSKLLRKISGAGGILAFDAAGNLYSAQEKYYGSGGRILVFPPGASTPAYTITKGIYNPGALTTDASDDLYVANASHNDIAVYAPGSSSPSRTITVATGLEDPQAIAFDRSGNLYAANTFESTVTVYAPGSNDVLRTITDGVVSPSALAFDGADNLYVANVHGNPGGSEVSGTITVYGPGQVDPFLEVNKGIEGAYYSLAFDRSDDLYVASGCPYRENPIVVYAHGSRSPLRTISQGIAFPCAIALDASGHLYVANVGSNTVAVFPPGGSDPSRTITDGVDYPDALTINRSGELFVTNARGGSGKTWGSITVYRPGREIPSRRINRGLTGGGGPGGSVFGPSGELYVVDVPKIIVYSQSGSRVRTIRRGLDVPTSPIFDTAGNLYVANQNNSTITEYAAGRDKLIRTIPAVEAYPDALIFGPP